MSSHRRKHLERSRVREWTPDHYWPEDQGWPDDRDWPRDDEQWRDEQWRDEQDAPTSPLRRLRAERPRGREWTPDHHWPEDQGWPDQRDWLREEADDKLRHGRRPALVTFVIAALFVAGLGVYGAARQHHAAVAALQGSMSTPCAGQAGATAGRCRHSSAPGGVTDGSGRPAPVASEPAAQPGTPAPASAGPRPTPSTHPSATMTAAPTPTAAPSPAGSVSPLPGTPGTPGTPGSAATQVLALINQTRAQASLPPLAISFGLDTSALGHTTVMAAGCGLLHQCPGEPTLGARETAAGVDWTSAGENIGEGGPEPDTTANIAALAVSLTQAMLNETPPHDGHRLNLLSSSFHRIGIYVLRDANGTVWMTQDFSN
ncbi:MAG TPA: CAP domain-containing protein [Streptosporangiaceae bacterium]|nr:CAP domain-containing protein [Streptosporangiaceae bacterium]